MRNFLSVIIIPGRRKLMLVKSGRAEIFNHIYELYESGKLYFFIGSGNGGDTIPTTELYVNEIIDEVNKENRGIFIFNQTNLTLNINYTLTVSNNSIQFASLGLYYTNSANAKTLFSRISIDPLFLEKGTSGTVKYTINF
jgi:hypothetical protein